MKNIVLALLFICVAFVANAKVIIKGTLTNDYPEADSIHILEHDGIALVKIKTVALEENVKGVNFKFEFNTAFVYFDPTFIPNLEIQ